MANENNNTDDGWGSPEEDQTPRQKPSSKAKSPDFQIDDYAQNGQQSRGGSRGYKNGEGRAEGGSRGEYAGRRDDFRGSQPRNNQRGDWDAPRDDYRGGGSRNSGNNYQRDNDGSGRYGGGGASRGGKRNDDDWDFEGGQGQPGGNGPPRRTPRAEEDFVRDRSDRGGGYRGGGGRDYGGGNGYEDRRRGDGMGVGRSERYGDGPGQREGAPKGQSYIPPEVKIEKIKMGKNFGKYDDTPISITGPGHADISPLKHTFKDSQLSEQLLANLKTLGYKHPTPVQKCALPCILAGKDIMACAQTGSGKTAAFLLPVISKLIDDNYEAREMNRQLPEAIVVAPTRELATQIHADATLFCKNTKIKTQLVYGGTDVRYQKSKTSSGCNILIGTPGRIDDFVNRDYIGLEHCKYFILDEADRMLDMGFEPQMKKLAGDHDMPDTEERHTLLFSATFPDKVQTLAKQFLRKDYLFIEVGIVGGACQDVEQVFMKVENNEAVKSDRLEKLVQEAEDTQQRTLIFVETKRKADFIACMLSQTNIPTTSIHGGRLQPEREQALRDFKSGTCPILVATSVAARGLDIPEVQHVINYELPKEIEDYVHRIGRTGRCGNTGRSTSFYDEIDDAPLAHLLVKTLSDAQQEVPDWLQEAAEQNAPNPHSHGRFGGRDNRERDNYRGRDRNDNYRSSNRRPPSQDRPRMTESGGTSGGRSSRNDAGSGDDWNAPTRAAAPPPQATKKMAPVRKDDDDSDGWD